MPLKLIERPSVAIVSSRISRQHPGWPSWLDALRRCVATSEPGTSFLVAPDTTTADLVARAATVHNRTVVQIDLPRNGRRAPSLDEWTKRVTTTIRQPPKSGQGLVFASPPIKATQADSQLPLRDQMLLGLSKQVLALYVRPAGHVEALLKRRLTQPQWGPGSTRIALLDGLTPGWLVQRFQQRGAIGLAAISRSSSDSISVQPASEAGPPQVTLPSGYLAHCTRGRDGAWPNQTRREYLDELLVKRLSGYRSPYDSLRHILLSRRLIGSAESVRGSRPVVCFTEISLDNLASKRTFRPHRARWDFEPYGISICRTWLKRHGAAPVRYVSAECREVDPRLQVASSTTRSGQLIDWRKEREWRYLGDVDLDRVPTDAAFVFVPTAAVANQLQPISRFPIYVAPQGE